MWLYSKETKYLFLACVGVTNGYCKHFFTIILINAEVDNSISLTTDDSGDKSQESSETVKGNCTISLFYWVEYILNWRKLLESICIV